MFCSNVEKSFDSRNNNPTLSHLNIHCWASSIKNTYLEILLVNLVSACIICDTGIFDCLCVHVCVCVNAIVCLRPTFSVYVYTWKKVSSTSYTFWIWYNLDGACMLDSHCFLLLFAYLCVSVICLTSNFWHEPEIIKTDTAHIWMCHFWLVNWVSPLQYLVTL